MSDEGRKVWGEWGGEMDFNRTISLDRRIEVFNRMVESGDYDGVKRLLSGVNYSIVDVKLKHDILHIALLSYDEQMMNLVKGIIPPFKKNVNLKFVCMDYLNHPSLLQLLKFNCYDGYFYKVYGIDESIDFCLENGKNNIVEFLQQFKEGLQID